MLLIIKINVVSYKLMYSPNTIGHSHLFFKPCETEIGHNISALGNNLVERGVHWLCVDKSNTQLPLQTRSK
jgi:hypothetical protein